MPGLTKQDVPVDGNIYVWASNSEKTETMKLLEQMEEGHKEQVSGCKYFLGDKRYDNTKIIRCLEERDISSIIDIRNCWKDGEETHQYRDTQLVYNYKGTVWYVGDNGRIRSNK